MMVYDKLIRVEKSDGKGGWEFHSNLLAYKMDLRGGESYESNQAVGVFKSVWRTRYTQVTRKIDGTFRFLFEDRYHYVNDHRDLERKRRRDGREFECEIRDNQE